MKKPESERKIENHILAESLKQDGIDINKIEKLDNALTNTKQNPQSAEKVESQY